MAPSESARVAAPTGGSEAARIRAGSPQTHPELFIPPEGFADRFDRHPLGFTHNLHTLDLFQFDSLLGLARRFAPHPRDYFVAAAAPSAATEFKAVSHGQCTVEEAMQRIDTSAVRVLLKRPEDHDPRFRRLLDTLFEQVTALRGGLAGERVVRLESAVFVTSASAITPCHFDPEIAFFAQIDGHKEYHVYSPASMSEAELESFYREGVVSIAEVDLASRNPQLEHVFALEPGDGHHQPQNSPHWVRTGAARSVSYSFVFETDVSRARNRTRACNHYLRRAGIDPREPGVSPARDAAKAAAIRVMFPIRRRVNGLAARLRKA